MNGRISILKRGESRSPRTRGPGRLTASVTGVAIAMAVAGLLLSLCPRQDAWALAPAPTLEYILSGDGDGSDAAAMVVPGPAGVPYVCGRVWHEATGYDMTVACLAEAPNGWSVTWNDALDGDDQACDVAVAADGSLYVYGSAGSGLDEKPVLLKLSSQGALLWAAYQAVSPWGRPVGLGLDADGNVYACSTEDNEDAGGTIGVLTKYGPDGSQAWSKRFGIATYKPETVPTDLCVTPAGRSYVVGYATGVDIGRRAFAVSFRASGTKLWSRVYDGAGRAGAAFRAVAKCPDGGVYAAGEARSDARDLLLVRYAADGTRAWTRRMGAYDGHDQWATDVAVDGRGRLAFCGGWRAADRGFYVAALRLDRTLRWSHNYQGDRHYGWAEAIAVDTADRVSVTGNARGALVGTVFCPGPVATYAFTTAGERRWRTLWPSADMTWITPDGPAPRALAVWGASAVWVCGSTEYRQVTGSDQFVVGWPL